MNVIQRANESMMSQSKRLVTFIGSQVSKLGLTARPVFKWLLIYSLIPLTFLFMMAGLNLLALVSALLWICFVQWS